MQSFFQAVSDSKVTQHIAALLIAIASYFFVKLIIFKALRKLAKRSHNNYDDMLLAHLQASKLIYSVPLVIIYLYINAFLPKWELIQNILFIGLAFFVVRVITSSLDALNDLYNSVRDSKTKPIKGYVQMAKIFVYIIGIIVVIGTVIDQPPLTILSGVGAFTAVILLIFRDTILSLVASVQISANHLLHVGDWIEMPRYGADGDVIDIALHTVRVQNFDKTITTIPTYKFIEESFKNWRGMTESGGRRIKRSVFINLDSVRHYTEADIQKLKDSKILREYLNRQEKELADYNADPAHQHMLERRQLTNIGTFRAYIQFYLEHHKSIRNDMTLLVRQLAPTPAGLPIEIYCFTATTVWNEYEAIQADIFDHVLATVRLFDLRLYQYMGAVQTLESSP
jgi:miniconductance mechanosensitive channel